MTKYWALGYDGTPEEVEVVSWGGLADCWATIKDCEEEIHISELFDSREGAMGLAIKIKSSRRKWLAQFNGQFDVDSAPEETKAWLSIINNENIPDA